MSIFNLLKEIKNRPADTSPEKTKMLVDAYFSNAWFLVIIELFIIGIICLYVFSGKNGLDFIEIKLVCIILLSILPFYVFIRHIALGYENLEKLGIHSKFIPNNIDLLKTSEKIKYHGGCYDPLKRSRYYTYTIYHHFKNN